MYLQFIFFALQADTSYFQETGNWAEIANITKQEQQFIFFGEMIAFKSWKSGL